MEALYPCGVVSVGTEEQGGVERLESSCDVLRFGAVDKLSNLDVRADVEVAQLFSDAFIRFVKQQVPDDEAFVLPLPELPAQLLALLVGHVDAIAPQYPQLAALERNAAPRQAADQRREFRRCRCRGEVDDVWPIRWSQHLLKPFPGQDDQKPSRH